MASSPQIQQPRPSYKVSASQLEQHLLAVQQQQHVTRSTETSSASDDLAPPFDPEPTPGPDGSEQQMWTTQSDQDPSGFINYSQFAGDFIGLPDHLDDLFPELRDTTKTGEYDVF